MTAARNEDFLFAQEAQNLGYVTEEQVEEGFLLQRRMSEELRIEERLAVILVKRGWLADEQARRVYAIIEPAGARTQIDGYRLLAKIGRGAMGTVYKARHLRLNRLVAIKILRRDLAADKTQIERLKGEAELLASLDHPNIVRAIDAGESNGFPYFVMEYVEGENLRDRLVRGPLPEERALEIARALADALERARRMGVVHRDVKPGNVLLTRRGVPKLMDLGLAKGPVDLGLTQHGATVGTPQFISPEQAQDPRKADTRSDIYSLGATLYAMLTQRPPFEGATLAEIITKVLYEQPTPIRVRAPEVSAEVSYLVERMMLKDPSLRYATPAAVVEDIDRVLGGRSIIPSGFTGNWEAYLLRQRMRKWMRRAAVAGVVLVLGGISAFIWRDRVETRRSIERATAHGQEIVGRPLADLEQAPVPVIETLEPPEAVERARDWARQFATEARARLERTIEDNEDMREDEEAAGSLSSLRPDVDRRIGRLQVVRQTYEALQDTFEDVAEALVAPSYGRAFETVGAQLGRLPVQAPAPAFQVLRTVEDILKLASTQRLTVLAEEASVHARAARSLGAFTAAWRDFGAALEGDAFVANQQLEAARVAARTLVERAVELEKDVGVVESVNEVENLGLTMRTYEFNALRQRLEKTRKAFALDVAKSFREFAGVTPPRVDVGALIELVAARLETVVGGVDDAVAAEWQKLDDAVTALGEQEGPFDLAAVDALLAKLRKFQAAAQGSYPGLAANAKLRADSLMKERVEYQATRQSFYEDTLQAVLAEIRAGDVRGIRDALAAQQKARDVRLPAEDRVEALAAAEAPLAALQRLGLARLERRLAQKKTRLRDVRLAGGDVIQRGTLQAVDTAARTFRLLLRGDRRGPETIPVAALHPLELLALAQETGQVGSEVVAIAHLAALPVEGDVPGVDVRPQIAAYTEAQRLFEPVGTADEWKHWVDSELANLARAQLMREDNARTTEQSADDAASKEQWVKAHAAINRLLDASGRLRHTDYFDTYQAQIEKLAVKIKDALERNELLRMVPGATVKEDPKTGRTRIHFDFDTPALQKQNLVHGCGVFERQRAMVAQTPHTTEPYQLHLLKGVEGLLRDRPLALRQMFDPALPIEVSFTIDTLAGSYLLAIDIDGAKVAVCSADPRELGHVLPSDVPKLESEKKTAPPAYRFYGLGRGVAFEETGLTTFGTAFPWRGWDWPQAGRGRNHDDWEKLDLADPDDRLFAFAPGRRYRVRVVRNWDVMQIFVDEKLVGEKRNEAWRRLGTASDREKRMNHGSGRIQILTWTPMILDDLTLEGTLQRRWRANRQRALNAQDDEN